MLLKLYRKIKNKLLPLKNKWKNIEYFDVKWKQRISEMSNFIPKDSISIMDLGCGKMWLKEFLRSEVKYFPVDYVSRGKDTIICDFNKKQFPSIKTACIFISGALEYVTDYKWFIQQVAQHSSHVVLSYCTTEEYPIIRQREISAWVNHMSEKEIIELFQENKMFLIKNGNINNNPIFLFSKNKE